MRIEGKWSPGGVPFIVAFLRCESWHIEETVAFLIDSGASRTTLLDSDAERLGIDFSRLERFEEGTTGIGGMVETYILPSVKLSFRTTEGVHEEEFREIFVLRHRPRNREEEERIKALPSLLGRDFLNEYKVILDRRRGRITITDEDEE